MFLSVKSILEKRKEHDFQIQTWNNRRNSVRHIKSDKYLQIANEYSISEKEKKEIDCFFVSTYGEKIPYTCHQFYAAHSGIFDPHYFPEIIYYPYFERFMNIWSSYAGVFEDKNVIPLVAKAAGVLMPKTIVSGTKGIYRDQNNSFISRNDAALILSNQEKAFCKISTSSSGGNGCFVLDSDVDAEETLSRLGCDFVVQELINCDSSIKQLYPKSVNTFRITTYRWKDELFSMPVAMRMGQNGSVVDNASSGGMFIGVKNDGTLMDKAMTVDNRKFMKHPDTGFLFNGHKINNFEKVIKAAKRMHALLPQLGVIGWDFTVNQNGEPLLIEANIMNVSYRLGQMALGIPAFGDRTAEILQWIKKMKKTPYTQLKKHSFGN